MRVFFRGGEAMNDPPIPEKPLADNHVWIERDTGNMFIGRKGEWIPVGVHKKLTFIQRIKKLIGINL
tara:strand:- start:124 stop:324 length:201 start_codon:yes stop_codon:yes gene_type:complete